LRLVFHTPGDILLNDIAPDGRILLSYGPPRARMMSWSGDAPERELSWFDWPTVADLSEDGKFVLFHEWGEAVAARPTVYIRGLDGSNAVRLGDGKALSLSPDGRWALALVDKDRPQLVMLPTGTGQSRVIPTVGITDVYWAKWFPDSQRILLAAADEKGVPQTYLQDAETGRLTQVAERGMLGMLVAPNGQQFLALDPSGSYSLWPVAGGDPVPVPGLRPEDRPVQWSADGRLLYVRSGGENSIRLDRYTLVTGHREPWHELIPRDLAGLIGVATGRSEFAMTRDGRAAVYTYWTSFSDVFLVEGMREVLR
jgi:WD40 repeat protein